VATIPLNGRPSNRRQRLPRAGAGALALTLASTLLAGCSGSSGASGAGSGTTVAPATTVATVPALPADLPQKGACSLATKAEVEAAIGAKVVNGKEDSQPGRSLCSFVLATANDQSVALVSTSSSGVPAFFTNAREKAAAPQTVTAGDQAFVSGGLGLVRRANTMVTIVVALRQDQAQLTAAATKLALAVGTHL
jgi:hypothetical protein